jgi:CHAD domain-containing protein
MRGALRRLRAAMSLFSAVAGDDRAEAIKTAFQQQAFGS